MTVLLNGVINGILAAQTSMQTAVRVSTQRQQTAGVLVPRFRPPPRVSTGQLDGLPDYMVATRGSPYHYAAPLAMQLVVYQDDVRLYEIVEADRVRGFAVGLEYEWDAEQKHRTIIAKDEEGVSLHRFYEGRISFRLEPK